MAWHNVSMKDISPSEPIIPEGSYIFELSPGAKYSDTGTLLCSARVKDDGEFTGKAVFFSYPDPESFSRAGKPNTWAAVALKRLEVALGVDINESEDPAHYLNRVAGNTFRSSIKHTAPTDEYPTPKANLSIMNVKASE